MAGNVGLRGWLLQRGTAVVMAVYLLMLVSLMAFNQPLEHHVWQALFTPLWMKIATALFLFSLFVHAWLGLRNVLVDYIRSGALRLGVQAAIIMALLIYAAWAVKILWGSLI